MHIILCGVSFFVLLFVKHVVLLYYHTKRHLCSLHILLTTYHKTNFEFENELLGPLIFSICRFGNNGKTGTGESNISLMFKCPHSFIV